ncbi:MAG: type II toxin-antitoxin system VapC family toxin [Methylophilaceae bacterium]
MIALDTNVLARIVTQDEPEQLQAARILVKENACFVPLTVTLELEWVLRSPYKLDMIIVADAFNKLLQVRNLHFEREPSIRRAVTLYRNGFDFSDAMHHAVSEGCDELATFDNQFICKAAHAGMSHIVRRP